MTERCADIKPTTSWWIMRRIRRAMTLLFEVYKSRIWKTQFSCRRARICKVVSGKPAMAKPGIPGSDAAGHSLGCLLSRHCGHLCHAPEHGVLDGRQGRVEWRRGSLAPDLSGARVLLADEEGFQGLLQHIGEENPFYERLIAIALEVKPREPFGLWEYVDKGFRHLITKMTNLDPARRITALEALKHPWFCQ